MLYCLISPDTCLAEGGAISPLVRQPMLLRKDWEEGDNEICLSFSDAILTN